MLKSVITMAGAAVIAGLIVFLTSAPPKANAAGVSAEPGELASTVKGAPCSTHGWPNFEPSCQFDFRKPAHEARAVRVIALR